MPYTLGEVKLPAAGEDEEKGRDGAWWSNDDVRLDAVLDEGLTGLAMTEVGRVAVAVSVAEGLMALMAEIELVATRVCNCRVAPLLPHLLTLASLIVSNAVMMMMSSQYEYE